MIQYKSSPQNSVTNLISLKVSKGLGICVTHMLRTSSRIPSLLNPCYFHLGASFISSQHSMSLTTIS